MDWLQIFKALFRSLVIPLLVKEISVWIPNFSEWLIKTATGILPWRDDQERYFEEFLQDIQEYENSLCQIFVAIGCASACLSIRQQLLRKQRELRDQSYPELAGAYIYQINTESLALMGACRFTHLPFTDTPSVVGELRTIVEIDENNKITRSETRIKWKSHTIKFIDRYHMRVEYTIPINRSLIRGSMVLSYNQEGEKEFGGTINRYPIQDGIIKLENFPQNYTTTQKAKGKRQKAKVGEKWVSAFVNVLTKMLTAIKKNPH